MNLIKIHGRESWLCSSQLSLFFRLKTLPWICHRLWLTIIVSLAVSLQADGPTCPGEQVSFMCSSLPFSTSQFFWFYDKIELVATESIISPMTINRGGEEFSLSTPAFGVSSIEFTATDDVNGRILQCGSSSTTGSIGSSNPITLQVADLGMLLFKVVVMHLL